MKRVVAGLAAVGLLFSACSSGNGGSGASVTGPSGTSPGGAVTATDDRVPAGDWRARQDEYLAQATQKPLDGDSTLALLAHAERARRDPSFAFDASQVSVEDYAKRFASLENLDDTSDFRINEFLFALADDADVLPADVRDGFEQQVLGAKYWWEFPTPAGRTDNQYYWTENHLAIFLANEYVAGQLYPDRTFAIGDLTGRAHMEHARPRLLEWMGLRARYGFSEWLSDVYWMEDLKGMLLLAEHADDPELAAGASKILDLMFVELASHLHDGMFGATHGRSYNKDKMVATDEDTYNLAKMVFDDSPLPYTGVDTGTLLATAHRYVPPEVARRIAASDDVAVIRQKQGYTIDPKETISADPRHPDGLPYDDPIVWWGASIQFPWQIVPLSVGMIRDHRLMDTELFGKVSALRDLIETGSIPDLQKLAQSQAEAFNAGTLSQADSYTWRSPEAMLSTAQDWRPGWRSEQAHVWQATLGPETVVFTTHPSEPVPKTTDWHKDAGYWTGSATLPKSVQTENVGISMYAPAYAANDSISLLDYQPMTHAYFPQSTFDDVVEQDGWVFGRKGDGYIALWSWRSASFRASDPATEPTRDMTEPFDLVAAGGADNVWIYEVGRKADWEGKGADPFGAFVAAVSGAKVTVTPLAPNGEHRAADGFDVSYLSPTRGEVAVSWKGPLMVRGKEVDVHADERWDSPWARSSWGSGKYTAEADGATLTIDLSPYLQYVPRAP